jgi:hypothetical protein
MPPSQPPSYTLIARYFLKTPSFRFPLRAGGTKPLRFPSRSGGNLKEGGIVNFDCAVGKCLCVGFSKCPPPNLPRTRGRSRDSLPACGEGWGGGAMFNTNRRASVHKKTAVDPLLQVPPASRGNQAPSVPLAKRGGTLRRGAIVNSALAIGISACALVFRNAPLPTSPVHGGGAATPSPRAGRVGVGARCLNLYAKTLTYSVWKRSFRLMLPAC